MDVLTPAKFANQLGTFNELPKKRPSLLTNLLQEPVSVNPGECLNNSKTKARPDHLPTVLTHLKYIAGFVQELVVEVDELGIAETRPKKKNMPKQTKKRRTNMQKSQYHFNRATTKSFKYRNYFDPSLQVENKLLGIAELVSKFGGVNHILIKNFLGG